MTIEEMKARKAELGYTNETVAELSGVPLGTVQKIFAGETKSPRYETVRKLVKLLAAQEQGSDRYEYSLGSGSVTVMEAPAMGYEYIAHAADRSSTQVGDFRLVPPQKTIGIADGKYRMPPDELFFDDEISGMFEDI